MPPMRTPLLVVVAFLGLAALISSAHRHTDAWAPPPVPDDEIRYLPSGQSLALMSMGFEPVLADLLWVKAVLLFGERYGEADQSWYPWLFHMADLASDLEPQYRAVYKMGGTMLRTDSVFVEQSNLIFQKGMKAMPGEWYFPFAIGMNYYQQLEDPAIAARFIRRAAETGEGPVYLRNLAASMLSDANQLEVARQFLVEEARVLPRGAARDVTMAKVYEIAYQIAARDAGLAVAAYRDREGRLPTAPGDIVAAGFVLPPDPMGDTSYLAHLGVRPAPADQLGWVWDPDPDAKIGTVASLGFGHVFTQIREATGYGSEGLILEGGH